MPKESSQELVQKTVAQIKSRKHIRTLSSGAMFVYNEVSGIYVPQAEEVLHQEIEAMLVEKATRYTVGEIITKIQRTTVASIDDFDNDEDIVHVGNGLLDLTTMELLDHDRTYLSLRKVAANYDPNADCPVFKKFVETTLDENDRVVVQQMLGFCLLNIYRYRRAFVYVGPTHTGKTSLMNAIIAFLGGENTVSISLQSLCDTTSYDTHELMGAMANVFDELESDDVKRYGRLKQLTGDSRVRAREIYGKPFDFWNKAKLVFACNELPPVPKADDAFYGRWVIVPMDNVFVEGSTADDRMLERMTTPVELSGMLNFALDGLKMLNLFHGFCYPTDPQVQRIRWLAYSGDPIARFVSECVKFEQGEITPKQTVYEFYMRFCELCGAAAVDEISFFMRITNYLGNRVSDCRPSEVNRQRAFRGMSVELPKRTRPGGRFVYRDVSLNPSTFTDDGE